MSSENIHEGGIGSNSMELIEIQLNGEVHQIEKTASVLDLVNSMPLESAAVAVERNRAIVPKSQHGDTLLQPGDHIEIVTIVGGG
ncbi:MAG: sulfur carrier protein ThiS [Planctomycetota bacterium]|jgi:sulfur carrier protein|nr:sulfur carrier protein ThiS [Planctomycetota bacterium]MDG2085058.1 sulfur carrier protein ThiS [Planctomycetota bacterium]